MMKVIVMFLQRRIENNKQQPIFLTKNNSSYKKLEKAMKEPVKEYDQIKKTCMSLKAVQIVIFKLNDS